MRVDGYVCDTPTCPRWQGYAAAHQADSGWTLGAFADYCPDHTPKQPRKCGRRIAGSVLAWAGEHQMDPCYCIRPPQHEGDCGCSHDSPADAVSESTEP